MPILEQNIAGGQQHLPSPGALPNKARRYEILCYRVCDGPPSRAVKSRTAAGIKRGSVMVTGRWQMNCGTGCAVTKCGKDPEKEGG